MCVPPAQLDVNVHPRKAEVRLRHERVVYGAVAHAVREALLAAGAALGAPAVAPGVRSPRGEAIGWPQAAGAQRRGLLAAAGLPRAALPGAAPYAQPVARLAAEVPLDASAGSEASLATEAHWAEGEPLAAAAVLPALRALGQVDLTYVVAEGPDGLYLVDQHAAHERVLYERALAGEQPSGRPLLAAALAELTPAQAALAEQHGAALAALGWELAPTDGAALLVRALPQPLAGRDPATALGEYLDALEAEEGRSAPDRVGGGARLPRRGCARATGWGRSSGASCWRRWSVPISRSAARTAGRRCCGWAATSWSAPSADGNDITRRGRYVEMTRGIRLVHCARAIPTRRCYAMPAVRSVRLPGSEVQRGRACCRMLPSHETGPITRSIANTTPIAGPPNTSRAQHGRVNHHRRGGIAPGGSGHRTLLDSDDCHQRRTVVTGRLSRPPRASPDMPSCCWS